MSLGRNAPRHPFCNLKSRSVFFFPGTLSSEGTGEEIRSEKASCKKSFFKRKNLVLVRVKIVALDCYKRCQITIVILIGFAFRHTPRKILLKSNFYSIMWPDIFATVCLILGYLIKKFFFFSTDHENSGKNHDS